MQHKVGEAYRSAMNYFSDVKSKSDFKETGMLTPDEFVDAGESLVLKFPTWSWQKTHPDFEVDYLPTDKQYLMTQAVPSEIRVDDLHSDTGQLTLVDGSWSITGENRQDAYQSSRSNVFQGLRVIENFDPKKEKENKNKLSLENLDNLVLGENKEETLVIDNRESRLRLYDLSITWDKYYRTPRMWLTGYDNNGRVLSPDDVFDDVVSVYQRKTVTVEPHPMFGTPCASIHPCKHSEMMRSVIKRWEGDGKEMTSDLALIIYLKLLSSVMPTINYDFTTDIDM